MLLKKINYTGIGKTTLAKEICIRWARDRFLADEFDSIIFIPLRSVQQRSFKEVMVEHVGEIDYQKLYKSAGSRCLLILEGLDEMAINHRQNDQVLRCLIENTLLEKAKILITSRPYACENLIACRTIEVVGFGDKEIRKFVENSFCNDAESIEEFMKQLTEYSQLKSLCYVPLNLVMVIDIFCFNQNRLPSTLTELYRLFIVMILQREIMKGNVNKLPAACNIEASLSKLLIDKGIPKEAVVVHLLCRLAYNAFFESYSNEKRGIKRWKEPKIIFTESNLTESGIQVTNDFDWFGLLKATHTHHIPRDTVTYNFLHLSVQEFLCSLYMSTLSQQEQINLLSECFEDYPNVFTFFCGLTGLVCNQMYKFVSLQLSSSNVITALRCIYESNYSYPVQFTSPLSFTLDMSGKTLLPYDCLCLSWLLSCYPVSELKMDFCHIEDIGAKLLVRHYLNNNFTGRLLEVLNLHGNHFTTVGLRDIMKIVTKSKPPL